MAEAAALALQVVGTFAKMRGAREDARDERAALEASARNREIEGAHLRREAMLKRAIGQRKAIQERRRQNLIQSRYMARLGKSGTTGVGPAVQLAELEGIASGNVRSVLWEGEELARGLETEATMKDYKASILRHEGRLVERRGRRKAGAALVSGGSRMFGSYAKTSPVGGGSRGGGLVGRIDASTGFT